LIAVKTRNTGYSYDIIVISIILDSISPIPTPTRVEAVNYETLFPEMSPMLFRFANCTFMLALDAADSKKQMFLPILAVEARAKK
jgi:hypothetical protein